MKPHALLPPALALALLLAACAPSAPATPTPTPTPTLDPDAQMAAELWQRLQAAGYRDGWATVPGKGTLYTGQPPHGALLSTYLSPEAAQAMKRKAGEMPDGAIIVKENYSPDRSLDALTVMYKEAGYDPEHNDWFWAKYGPNGEVQAAGRVRDCLACHAAVQSNDSIFTFPLAPIEVASIPPTDEDRAMARELWQRLQAAGYREAWETVPGKGTLYEGQAPHGALLSTYLSPEAAQAMKRKAGEMPDGAIIVKENYSPDRSLDALTVMYKEAGYDPEHNDWFWAKYGADGQVQAAGKAGGCIACHGAVRSNDYVFTFPLALRQP